jgi:hypothetical protein
MKKTYLRLLGLSLLLLMAQPWAYAKHRPDSGDKPRKEASKATPVMNTLLSGVILDKEDNLIKREIPVRVYRNGVRIAELTPVNGMFTFDLKGQVDANDAIDVVIWPEREDRWGHHGGKTIHVNAATAQNVIMKIDYEYRRGCRTVYINNI